MTGNSLGSGNTVSDLPNGSIMLISDISISKTISNSISKVTGLKHNRGGPWGFGGFDPFMDRWMGPERTFRRHGGLRYYILWLLSKKTMNGSEIMSEIQRQTMGFWKPSPGSIYPLLSTLEGEKLIEKNSEGKYDLTDEGKSTIGIPKSGDGTETGEYDIEKVLTDLESNVAYLSEIRFDVEQYAERLKKIVEILQKISDMSS